MFRYNREHFRSLSNAQRCDIVLDIDEALAKTLPRVFENVPALSHESCVYFLHDNAVYSVPQDKILMIKHL